MRERSRRRAGSRLQRTVEAIGRAIVTGVREPGSVLPVEDVPAARHAVGRTVMREV